MTKILSLGLVFCLLACSTAPHAPVSAPVAIVTPAAPAAPDAADACVSPEQWMAKVKTNTAPLQPVIVSDKSGDEAAKLIAAFNAAPPASHVVADRFIVFAFRVPGVPVALVGFFKNNCSTEYSKLAVTTAQHLVNGDWPQPGNPA